MPAQLAPGDRAALDRIVGQLETAWNAMNGVAYAAPFAADADFVTVRGEHFRGRDAIAAGHAAIFQTIYAGSTNRCTVESARLVGPGVALGHVRSTLDAPTGPLAGRRASRFSVVLTQGTDGWAIASLHNTVEASPGQPKAPGHGAGATERSAFEAASAAFHEALRTNDVDALLAWVADDILMMPPGEAAVRGKHALRGWFTGFLSQYRTSSLTLADREVFVGDGWAVEIGVYEWVLTPVVGGEPVCDCGSYMQLWTAQPEGPWRFAREIWNSGVAVPPLQ